MTPEICNLVKIASDNSTATLIDTRDSNTYTVAKLKDNRCWMTSSLNLVGSRALTSADSNVTNNWTLPASSNTNWNRNYGAFVHKSTNSQYPGVYYTWSAATAGTGNQNTAKDVNASGSVCPKGWRLPRGGDTSTANEFMAMLDAYGGGTDSTAVAKVLHPATPNLLLSGAYDNGQETAQGTSGRYWESTSYGIFNGNYDAYDPWLNASEVSFNNISVMFRGSMIRCIAIN